MNGNDLFGSDAAHRAIAASELGHTDARRRAGAAMYVDPLARARDGASNDQDDKLDTFAASEVTAIGREPDVVVIAPGTPGEWVRIDEAREWHDDYRRDSENDRPLEHVAENGPYEPSLADPAGVGVVAANWPGQVYALSPDFPLRQILEKHMPLMVGRLGWRRPGPCEVVESMPSGSPDCTNIATGFAIAPTLEQRLIFVWRACCVCRDKLRSDNRVARQTANESTIADLVDRAQTR